MQADDELSRDLVAMRAQHDKTSRRRDAMQVCAVALGRCQAASRPLPDWLYSAIMSYLWPITEKERRQWDDDKNAVKRLDVLFSLLGEGETPTEKHFECASKKFGPNGLSTEGVKKLWHRHGPTYLAAMKLKARRGQ